MNLVLTTNHILSRLSRNRHISLERKLETITQSVSSMSMERYSEIAGRVLSAVPDIHSNRSAFHTEEWDDRKICAENLQRVYGNPSSSDRSWRKQTWVKRTLREGESVMEYFLGTIRAESNTKLRTARETDGLTPDCEQDQYEHETSYTIYPATWLIRLGIRRGLRLRYFSSPTQGWKSTLESVCLVPDDALIFEFCKEGNVPAVRRLLAGGHASVRDTGSRGYTPLHFAAQNYHSELCRILKGAGADMSTLTHEKETAIYLAAHNSIYTTYAVLSEVFDTLRLLIDSMDFSDESGDGWKVLERLCDSRVELHGETEAKIDLLLWMLKLSSFELQTYFVEHKFAYMLQWVLEPHPVLEEASDLLLNFGGARVIDAIVPPQGYTILQKCIAWADTSGLISSILSRGPDIHRLGLGYHYTPQQETPTSLAMYSEQVFADWLSGLGTIEVDLEIFIEQELERNHVVHVGWEKDTLLDLFAYDYEHHVGLRKEFWTCSDCAQEIDIVIVQPYWRHLLERIKRRLDPDSPAQHDSEARETENADLGGVVEAASSSSHLAQEPDVTENAPFVDLSELPSESESEWESESESESESEFEGDIHGYPATVPIQSDCVYAREEVICMDCWVYYIRTGTRGPPHRTGTRRPPHVDEYSPSIDKSSEDEFSPYLIHS